MLRATLNGADLTDCRGGPVDVCGTTIMLWPTNLEHARFNGATINNCIFRKALMNKASFSRAKLNGVDMRDANLSDSDFTGAVTIALQLSGADLRGARNLMPTEAKVKARVQPARNGI